MRRLADRRPYLSAFALRCKSYCHSLQGGKMKRVLCGMAAAAAFFTVAVGAAFGGNHSGPEQAAKGTGSTSYTNTTSSPIIGTACFALVCFTAQIGSTTLATA